MVYSQLFILADETNLSMEKLGKLLGVSGMTLRRWRRQRPEAVLPTTYERSFSYGVEKMIVEGSLSPDSDLARAIMAKSRKRSFQATLRTLGFSPELLKEKGNENDRLMRGLSQIGNDRSRMQQVNGSRKLFSRLSRMGEEWKRRIGGLVLVVGSVHLSTIDKLVAYGALFYLVVPFDLIPDDIPVFGYLDDYAILGLALAYYMKRFSPLFDHPMGSAPKKRPSFRMSRTLTPNQP